MYYLQWSCSHFVGLRGTSPTLETIQMGYNKDVKTCSYEEKQRRLRMFKEVSFWDDFNSPKTKQNKNCGGFSLTKNLKGVNSVM